MTEPAGAPATHALEPWLRDILRCPVTGATGVSGADTAAQETR